jgi:hypothetical protein
MAEIFHFGPYLWLTDVPPGGTVNWSWGPFDWGRFVVTITPHGFINVDGPTGVDRRLVVENLQSHTTAGDAHFIHATVRNVGPDTIPFGYEVWLGGTRE